MNDPVSSTLQPIPAGILAQQPKLRMITYQITIGTSCSNHCKQKRKLKNYLLLPMMTEDVDCIIE